MNHHERMRILRSELGTKLTNFLGDALNDADNLPGKSALRAEIEEEFGDVEGINPEKLYEAYVDFARRGQDRSKRFDLRGHVSELVVTLVTRLEDADRLMPVEVESDEAIQAAIEKASDPYADEIGGALRKADDEERDAARALLKKAGYTP